jgi:RNase P subunit RPR2
MRHIEEVDFFCRKCKSSLHFAYKMIGNDAAKVLARGISLKCEKCKKAHRFSHSLTEGIIRDNIDDNNRFYL